MKTLCSLAAAVAALAMTASPQARTTHHPRWRSMTLTERRAVVTRDAQRHRSAVRYWLRHRGRYALSSAAPLPFCRAIGITAPGSVCVHGQRLVHDLAVLGRIDARLEAARAAAAQPAHLAGWLCIHNGRHPGVPGDPHEGRGYNGRYSGVLQMSSGWGGYPVSDWNTLPDMQVYADAEAVASRYGFSYSWMAGQWPQTFPPCASYFE